MLTSRIPADGGPIYTETIHYLHNHSTHWLVEPYNAASAVLFLIVAAIWLWRLRGQFSQHKFLLYGLIFLTIGGIGGTLYHALRTERAFLLMDWMPIVILSLSTTYWFVMRLYQRRWIAVTYLIGGFIAAWVGFFVSMSLLGLGNYSVSIGYGLIALQAVAPIVVYLYRTRFRHAVWFFTGIAAFGLAAIFRAADLNGWLPMGTHFLWHVLGAVMAYLLLEFIYRVEGEEKLQISPNAEDVIASRAVVD